jgi:calreticulin
MKVLSLSVMVFALLAVASAAVHFKETFDKNWESRWVKSKHFEKDGNQGAWGWSAGKFYNDADEDKGLQTTQDARFYGISAEFPEFSNKGKDLILQYSVKHEQNIDCGGGYIKLLPGGFDQTDFFGDTPYHIMFGPDICGSSTRKTHVIFTYKGKNNLIKKDVKCETDELTHLYTLIVHPDNTYEVQIDGKEVQKGSLKEDWDMLAPKEIKDPNAKKPADWVDDKQIPDPTDKKPEGWDDIPKEIADPEAKKPEDWDDELDGEWEAPMTANPDYKGEWKPKMIDNPAYKGEWIHPMVPNPDYVDDNNLYLYSNVKAVAFDLWQVKSGTIFDNIIVTDDAAEAKKFADKTTKTQEGEKKMKEKADEEKRKQEEEDRKKREEEEKNKAPEHTDEGEHKDEL